MLKINAIKIEVETNDGLYGSFIPFKKGLNIIRANNSTGKSTLFQSILYGLGFEELLGGKNDKTMQSVLKDQVEYPKDSYHTVIQSFVYLEIENLSGDIITTRRSITSPTRYPQLIDVYEGSHLIGKEKFVHYKSMYIHDKGGASNVDYGFHLYLLKFLGLTLPRVANTSGDLTSLYIQQLASAFIIEQKTGWSDFFATMPTYNIRNADGKIVEYLLDLDVFVNEKKKQRVISEKQINGSNWTNEYSKIQKLAKDCNGEVIGLTEKPMVFSQSDVIDIRIYLNDKDNSELGICDYLDHLKKKLRDTQDQDSRKVLSINNNIEILESTLKKYLTDVDLLSYNYETIQSDINIDNGKLVTYQKQLDFIENDLDKNKGVLKIRNLGTIIDLNISKGHCPTCHQDIKDSLLPNEVSQIPMRLEDNIAFLESQQKMIKISIESQRRIILEKTNRMNAISLEIQNKRQLIRDIKRDLISDDRLPSIAQFQEKIKLENRINYYSKVVTEFTIIKQQFQLLSEQFAQIIMKEKDIPKNVYSEIDISKINLLQTTFLKLIKDFNYSSKPFKAIKISPEKYLPVAQKVEGENLYYNIKFDSSASDFIRCLWAYYISLMHVSISKNGNHPEFLMFDEPKQQDMSINDFRKLLDILSKYKEQQIIVFASFENSDKTFQETTLNLNFNLIEITKKLVKPLNVK